ncbi:HAMP domain-containing protein [Halomonas sp. QX-2]|jgi:methyl-accepting chemotaxis protein/methyl-accepting chemotaxis protein-2 (aspartate sensor receptor)|uniref:HAMP domain-containing protein n=1 Tax=Vreelandella sedimenti TaxID=2729618 RepID=A0A7Z0SNF7_9GAMM|nr:MULTISPECIES: methyl-accepting chemotaxis protein [Halomonas]NYT73208.1 HAMP domain-containing protein [Halomonas sedimenti]|tara:strand:- start:17489 stop:19159 length:1671 start_codon:yes stop_codon:yes gene_type:complete
MNRLHQIKVKYALAFISVALALLVIVVADALLVNMVKSRLDTFITNYIPATSATLNGDRDLYQARVAEIEYLLSDPSSEQATALIAEFEENAQQAYDHMSHYAELMQNHPELTTQLANFETLYSDWKQEATHVFELHQSGNTAAALTMLSSSSLDDFNALRDIYDVSGINIEKATYQAEAAVVDRIQVQQTSTIIVALIIFIAATLTALLGPLMMSRAIRQISGRIKEITEGDGDLTARIESQRRDEIGELAQQFNAFIKRIDDTLQSVSSSTMSLQHASSEIAKGSQELAARTEQAAANLQQTSASMEQIAAVVNNASDSAQQADQLALSTRDLAQQGLHSMHSVEQTMDTINDSSSEISNIVSLIDSIAFQTNILALNASVEAARAGEHGRGFAVVAQEVRILASRSSDASKNIATLINTSLSRTKVGVDQVKQTGVTMQEMVKSIERVADVIAEISAGAKEQSVGIGQVNDAVNELDSMTQHNASMVEESSAAAAELREQADRLGALVGAFKLSNANEQPVLVRTALDSTANKPSPASPRRLASPQQPEWESF